MATGQAGGISVLDITFKAAADLSAAQYFFVKLSAANTVNVCAATTDIPVGILQNKPDAANEAARVRVYGTSKLKIESTITRNTLLMPHTTGEGMTATNNHPGAALALESTTTDADYAEVLLTPGAYVSTS